MKKNFKDFAKKEGLAKDEVKELRILAEAEDWRYKYLPVSMEIFLEDAFYLGWNVKNIYPKVREVLIELNSGRYYEAVLTGGIGVAKTSIAIYATFYQLYVVVPEKPDFQRKIVKKIGIFIQQSVENSF